MATTLLTDPAALVVAPTPPVVTTPASWETPAPDLTSPAPAPLAPVMSTSGPPVVTTPTQWLTRQELYEMKLADWRRDGQAKIDSAALEPDKYFAGKDLSFARDPKHAQVLALNTAVMDIYGDGGQVPLDETSLERGLLRQQMAYHLYGGRGADSEEAFHAETLKAAQGRKDTKELGIYLGGRGAAEAVVEFDDPAKSLGWSAVLADLRKQPGYDQTKDADYLEHFEDQKQQAASIMAPYAPQLDQIWKAMKQGGAGTPSEVGKKLLVASINPDPVEAGKGAVEAAKELSKEDAAAMAFRMYKEIPADQRPAFMDSLALLAKRLPKNEQPTFWGNMAKVGGQAVDDITRQAGEGAVMAAYGGEVTTLGKFFNYPGSEANTKQVAADVAKTRADMLARKNFTIDVRKISRDDYNPLKSAFGTDKIGLLEGAAYKLPGFAAFVGETAIPFIGQAAMYATMHEQAYEEMRDRLRTGDNPMSDADASAMALEMAGPVAIAQGKIMGAVSSQAFGKLPFFNKFLTGLSDGIKNRLVRGVVKAGVSATEGTVAMDAMALVPAVAQQAVHALGADVSSVDWGTELKTIKKGSLESFLTMLPLSIFSAAGGVNAEARNRAFARASDLELTAVGFKPEAIATLRAAAARGDASLGLALPSILETRDPNTPETKAAVEQLNTVLVEQRKATERLDQLGYAFPKITANPDGAFTVADGRTGEEIGRGNNLADVERLIKAHTTAIDDMTTDQLTALGSLLAGSHFTAKETGIEKEIDLGKVFNRDAVEARDPRFQERYAEERALLEQQEGGTGDVARNVLGESTTEVRNGIRTLVSKLYAGADLAIGMEEDFHGLRKRAKEKGTITREEEIAALRTADAVFGNNKPRDGKAARLIPEGMADADISETRLDEAIAALFTMYGGFRFKGPEGAERNALGVPRQVMAAHIGAMSRLEAAPTGKLKAFFDAVKARWGLALTRLYLLKKAEKAGEFDPKTLDTYLDKLMGTDQQQEHDARVAAEFKRVLELPEDLPGDHIALALGKDKGPDPLTRETRLEVVENPALFAGDNRESLKDLARLWVSNLKNRIIPVESKPGVSVEINWQGIKHGIRHSELIGSQIVPSIPDLIAKSRITGEVGKTFTLLSSFRVDGVTWIAKIIAKEQRQGVLLYDHAVFEKKTSAGSGGSRVSEEAAQNVPADRVTVGQALDSVKGVADKHSNLVDSGEAPSLALGPAHTADVLAGDALSRIRDPRRRVQAMTRIARNFDALKVSTERALLLSTAKQGKGELKRQANLQEEMLADQYVGEAYARHQGVLSDSDLTKIKSQPGHELLANPDSPLRGRLMSKRQAIAMHPDMFIANRPGEYDGADGVSRSAFGGTLMPDQAAQELFAAHLIKEPTADAMWNLLKQEQAFVTKMKDAEVAARDDIRAAKLRAKEEANQWLAERTGDQAANFSQKDEILRSLAAMDAILSALPPDIAGRIGGHTQMARIGGDEARVNYLQDKLAKADAELGKYLKVEFGKEFDRLLLSSRPQKDNPGERPKGTIGPDTHDIFKKIENEYIGMTGPEVEAEITRLESLLSAEGITPEDQAKYEKMLEMVSLTGNWIAASATRREQALASLQSLRDEGYMGRVIELAHQRERIAKGQQALLAATGKSGTAVERSQKAAKEQGLKDGLARDVRSFRGFEQAIVNAFGEKSAIGRALVDGERHAAHSKSDAIYSAGKRLEDVFLDLAGGKTVAARQLQWDMHQKTISIDGVLYAPADLIHATMMWRQEDGQRHMKGEFDDAGNHVGEWNYGQEWVDKAEAALSPAAKVVRQHLIDEYAKEYDRINAVFVKLYGMNLPKNLFYSPITVMPAKEGKGRDLVPEGTYGAVESMSPGALKNRSQTAIAEPDFQDAIKVFLSHTRQMEHFIAYGEFSRDFNGLVSSKKLMNSVQAAIGKEGRDIIHGWADYLAAGGNRDATAYNGFNRWVGRMITRSASSILIGKASVICLQATTLTGGWYEMPTSAYLPRLAKLTLSPDGWSMWKAALDSPYMQRRVREMPVGVRLAMDTLHASKPSTMSLAVEKLGGMINGTDALFSAGTYAIIYDYQLKQAKQLGIENPEAYAHEAAERGVDRVSQPTRAATRSLWENTAKGNVRLMWAFGSEARQKLALAAFTAGNPEASMGRKVRALSITFLAQGMISTLLRQSLRQASGDDKTDMLDPETWNWKHLAVASLMSPFQGLPILGDVGQGLVSASVGDFQPQGNILSGVANAGRAIHHLDKTLTGQRDTKQVIKDVDDLLSGMAVSSDVMAEAASISHLAKFIYGVGDNIAEHVK